MPTYYFHVLESGALVEDNEGLELADAAEARMAALKGARSLLCSAVCAGRLPLDDAVAVADEHGATLFEVTYREAATNGHAT